MTVCLCSARHNGLGLARTVPAGVASRCHFSVITDGLIVLDTSVPQLAVKLLPACPGAGTLAELNAGASGTWWVTLKTKPSHRSDSVESSCRWEILALTVRQQSQ